MAKKKLIQEMIPVTVHPIFKDRLCYSLSKSGVLYRTLLENSLKEYNLVPPQAGILHILHGHGEYNQNLLGHEMNIDKASMVKFIDGLEQNGMVKRATDPNDRRAKLVTLTSKGKLVQKKISEDHCQLEKEIFKDFKKKDIDYLREMMPQVLQAILNHLHRS